jgi:hypothetical protein
LRQWKSKRTLLVTRLEKAESGERGVTKDKKTLLDIRYSLLGKEIGERILFDPLKCTSAKIFRLPAPSTANQLPLLLPFPWQSFR